MNQELITVNGDLVKQIPLDISESIGVKEIIKIPPQLVMPKWMPVEIKLDSPEFPVLLNLNFRIEQKKKLRSRKELEPREVAGHEVPRKKVRKTSLIQKLDRFLNFSDQSQNIQSAFDEYDWYDSAKLTGGKASDIITKRNIESFEKTTCVRKSFTLVTLFEGLMTFDRYRPGMFELGEGKEKMTYKQLFKIVNEKARTDEEIMRRVRAYHMLLTIGQGQLGQNKEMIYPKVRGPLRTSTAPLEMPEFKQTVEKPQQ